jgi:hypothetical protein
MGVLAAVVEDKIGSHPSNPSPAPARSSETLSLHACTPMFQPQRHRGEGVCSLTLFSTCNSSAVKRNIESIFAIARSNSEENLWGMLYVCLTGSRLTSCNHSDSIRRRVETVALNKESCSENYHSRIWDYGLEGLCSGAGFGGRSWGPSREG